MEDIIKFIREKDYKYIKELGNGSFGKTILLKDEEIDTLYACKKYAPAFDASTKYFEKFKGEIKILNEMLNENIVRIYNSYIYPKQQVGYIIMEYVDGNDVWEYISIKPNEINSVFEQLISAFSYLERKNICHRDIRAKNILVNSKGIVKIIDFGFGKEFTLDSAVSDSTKCNNWICELPDEMLVSEPKYNNLTDMYFLGNLINQIIIDNEITFKYKKILEKMIKKNPTERYKSFEEIYKILNERHISDLVIVTEKEKRIYKRFIDSLTNIITKIAFTATLEKDLNKIIEKLTILCNKNAFEDYILDNEELGKCFIIGKFDFKKQKYQLDLNNGEEYYDYAMYLNTIQNFVNWVGKCNDMQKKIIIDNIVNELGKIEKYFDIDDSDDLPF